MQLAKFCNGWCRKRAKSYNWANNGGYQKCYRFGQNGIVLEEKRYRFFCTLIFGEIWGVRFFEMIPVGFW